MTWESFSRIYSQGPVQAPQVRRGCELGGTHHSLYAMTEAADATVFKQVAPIAAKIVEEACLPAGVGQ